MDFPQAPPTPALGPRSRLATGLGVLALALYALLLSTNAGAVAGGSDSSGYMNHARLLASGSVHAQPRTIKGLPPSASAPYLYVPLGFKPAPNGNGMVPIYPTGFALFVLAFRPLAGWRHAGDLTIILHSLAGLLATYALGRMVGLGRAWSALGAAMVGASPLYLFMSVQAMSDVPSLAWTTLAVLAALKTFKHPAWALAAGVAIAVDVLLRPTNVLALVPVALALGTAPRRWILFLIGGLPGAAFFCAHSLAAYGGFAATGYGDASLGFGSRYVLPSLVQYATWLPAIFTPIAALCIVLPFCSSVRARTRVLLIAWILAFSAFYSAYKCTHEAWWYLRFLLPAVPAIVVASLLALRALVGNVPTLSFMGTSKIAFGAAVGLLVICDSWSNHLLDPLYIGTTEHRYEDVAFWMEKNVPQDAICLTMQASGAIFYYTGFTFIRWDFVDQADVGQIESAIWNAKRPLYAVLFPFEYNDPGVLARMPGNWTRVGLVGDVQILRRGLVAPNSQ